MLRSTASKYGLKTVGDLRKVPDLSIAGYPEYKTRWLPGLTASTASRNVKFAPLAGISAYALLDKGQIQSPGVFTTDPPLLAEVVELTQPRNMFGFQHVAPILSQMLVTEIGTRLTSTVNPVNSLLTLPAMIALNKAVTLDKKPAACGRQSVPEGEQASI